MLAKNKKGFTLIELLIVISIIGFLSAVGIISINGARNKAKIAKAKSDLGTIAKAMQILAIDTGEWPNHQPPFEVCPDPDDWTICTGEDNPNEIYDLNTPEAGLIETDGNYKNWQGPYLNFMPIDPWGKPYFFDTDYFPDPDDDSYWVAVAGSFGIDGSDYHAGGGEDDVFIILAEK